MTLGLSHSRTTALFSAAVAGFTWCLHLALTAPPGTSTSFESVLVSVATWGLVLAASWCCLAAAALMFEAFSGRRPDAPRWCLPPAALRRLVVLSSGAALGVGLAAPTMATAPPAPSTGPLTGVEGLVLPSRAVDTAAPVVGIHVVVPGDNLWRIAQRSQPDADDAALASSVAHLHSLNRDVIGPDPDLLVPGQRLLVPGTDR